MALWALAWLGSTPIGGPIVGWVGQDVGARWSLVIGGLAALLCGILALPALGRIDRRGTRGETAPDSLDQNAPIRVTTGEPHMLGRA
jgi:MFS family permease